MQKYRKTLSRQRQSLLFNPNGRTSTKKQALHYFTHTDEQMERELGLIPRHNKHAQPNVTDASNPSNKRLRKPDLQESKPLSLCICSMFKLHSQLVTGSTRREDTLPPQAAMLYIRSERRGRIRNTKTCRRQRTGRCNRQWLHYILRGPNCARRGDVGRLQTPFRLLT